MVGRDSVAAAKAYILSGSPGLLESWGSRQPLSTWWCEIAGAHAPPVAESAASWATRRTSVYVSAATMFVQDSMIGTICSVGRTQRIVEARGSAHFLTVIKAHGMQL